MTSSKPTFENSCQDFEIDVNVKIESKNLIRVNEERAKIAVLLVSIVLFLEIITLFSDYLEFNLLKSIQFGESISEKVVYSNDLRQQIIAIIHFVASIISAITFIQWFRRAYFNLHQRVRHCSQTEGWAAGSWFVPIICLYRPYQIMKEMFIETQTLIRKNSIEKVTNIDKFSIVGLWWTLWIVSGFLGNFLLKNSLRSETLEELINASIVSMILSLIGIPLAILTIKMIKAYSVMEVTLSKKELEVIDTYKAS